VPRATDDLADREALDELHPPDLRPPLHLQHFLPPRLGHRPGEGHQLNGRRRSLFPQGGSEFDRPGWVSIQAAPTVRRLPAACSSSRKRSNNSSLPASRADQHGLHGRVLQLLGHGGQGIGAVRLGGRHAGGPPGRPPARGRLRPRRRGLPGLREADDGNYHRDRPLAQDDRDGHAEESRACRRGQGSFEAIALEDADSAIGASTRSSPSTSLPSGSSRRRRSVQSASTSPGMGRSTSSGTRATPRLSERGTSGTSWPTGYARADSPSTGCWSRTCARSPRSARWGGRSADEHGPRHHHLHLCNRVNPARAEGQRRDTPGRLPPRPRCEVAADPREPRGRVLEDALDAVSLVGRIVPSDHLYRVHGEANRARVRQGSPWGPLFVLRVG
jgi:hypothetical protein